MAIFVVHLFQFLIISLGIFLSLGNEHYILNFLRERIDLTKVQQKNSFNTLIDLVVYLIAFFFLILIHIMSYNDFWYMLLVLFIWWSLAKTVQPMMRYRTIVYVLGTFFIIITWINPSNKMIFISASIGIVISYFFKFESEHIEANCLLRTKWMIKININHILRLIFLFNILLCILYYNKLMEYWISYCLEIIIFLCYLLLLKRIPRRNIKIIYLFIIYIIMKKEDNNHRTRIQYGEVKRKNSSNYISSDSQKMDVFEKDK